MKKYILFIGIVLFGIHFSTHAENDTTQLSHQINHVLKFIKYNEEKPVEQRKYLIPEDDFILKSSANDGKLNLFVDKSSSAYLELVEELKQFNQSYDKDNFALYVFYGRYFLSYEELLKGFDFDVKYSDRLKNADRESFLNDVKTLRGNKKTQDIYSWKLTRQIKDSLNAKYPKKRICVLWLLESYYLKRDGLDENGQEKREIVSKKGYYKNISYLNLNERIALSKLKHTFSQASNVAIGNAMDLLSLTKNAINILNNVKSEALTSGEWCPKCPPEKDSKAFDMYSIPKGGGLFDLYMFFEAEYGGVWMRVEENAKIVAKENNWYVANGELNMEENVAVLQETLETLAQELAFRDYSDLRYYYGEAYAQSKEYYYRDYYLKAQFLLLEELINQKIATDVGWLGYVPVIADDVATAYYSWQLSKQLPARLASIKNKLKADAAINAFSATTDVIGGFKSILKTGLRKSFGKTSIKKTIKNQGLFDASTTTSKISRAGKFSKFSSYLIPIRQIVKQRGFDGKTLEWILDKAGEQVWEYLNDQSPEQIEKIFQNLPTTSKDDAVKYLKKLKEEDEVLVFYHATTTSAYENIKTNGIKPEKGRINLEFNPANKGGFYVTTNIKQAEEWATRKEQYEQYIGNTNEKSVILKFIIPKYKLRLFKTKVFIDPDEEWADFCTKGRKGTLNHDYEIVTGPVLANPEKVIEQNKKPEAKKKDFNQTAIFTQQPADIFFEHLEIYRK